MSLQLRMTCSADEVEKEISTTRSGLRWDYTKRIRQGDNDRLLAFVGLKHASKYMDYKQKAKLEKQNAQW